MHWHKPRSSWPLFHESGCKSSYCDLSRSSLRSIAPARPPSFRTLAKSLPSALRVDPWWNGARCPELVAGSGKLVGMLMMV